MAAGKIYLSSAWHQFQMPCHLLACLSPFFVTAPAGSAVCVQLLGTAYEYSEQLFCIQSKAQQTPRKTFPLIVTFVKRCQEAASCQSSTHIELTHIDGTVLHAHVSPPSKHPFLCPNDWQGFNIATRDEKSPPSSSPSSPPPSCSILICSYGPQPVAS